MRIAILSSEVGAYKILSHINDPMIEPAIISSSKLSYSYNDNILKSDIIILDKEIVSCETIRELIDFTSPSIGFIITAKSMSGKLLVKYLKQGVTGFVSARNNYIEFGHHFDDFIERKATMSSDFVIALSKVMTYSKVKKLETLPKKRARITKQLLNGLSYKQVAEQNHISIETVRDHVKKIYKEFDVHSREELKKICQMQS